MADPRYMIHNVSVQSCPPSTPNPRKKLSHSVKYLGSSRPFCGILRPIMVRGKVRSK